MADGDAHTPRAAVPTQDQLAKAGEDEPKSRARTVLNLVVMLVVAVALATVFRAYISTAYLVPSGSMEPTLKVGQRYLINRIGMRINGPHVGEIVVFHPPKGAEQELCGPTPHVVTPRGASCSQPEPEEASVYFVKRIVAGPGDTIYISEGHVYRNGKREQDSYIDRCDGVSECNFPTPIKIPPGHWFMMGDNRGRSDDSRFWGPVPTAWIVGGAFVTFWPPDRIGTL
jgi:signal peptidase I